MPPAPPLTDDQAAGQELAAVSGKRKSTTVGRASFPKKMKAAGFEDQLQNYLVQTRACVEYGTLLVPCLCITCARVNLQLQKPDGIREGCRFIGFRRMKKEHDGSVSLIFNPTGVARADYGSYEYHGWNPSRTATHKAVIKV